MNTQTTLGLSERLTHKANLKGTRYGWLRLTPAYSVHLVSEILDTHQHERPVVLDPFCGTGTTALVCAERGIESDTTDINPFLLWLAHTKTHTYTADDVAAFSEKAPQVAAAIRKPGGPTLWTPPLHQIEKWWDEATLAALSRAISVINALAKEENAAVDLLKISFCRVMIGRANVSFGHQSMSFKKSGVQTLPRAAEEAVAEGWAEAARAIAAAALSPISSKPRALLCDARDLTKCLPDERYSCVITSPPYPNRMSYIRELRPYLYWLGYLGSGRDAGELDWKAIGGTWGCATSNVGKWTPEEPREVPYEGFYEILARIAGTSPLLSRYVHKYFYDMVAHVEGLFRVVRPGGDIHYIVGNSKFYDVILPVERIFASLFEAAGFRHVTVKAIRKRTSKKELYEYIVSARKRAVPGRSL